jgi:hypothetical protein
MRVLSGSGAASAQPESFSRHRHDAGSFCLLRFGFAGRSFGSRAHTCQPVQYLLREIVSGAKKPRQLSTGA